MSKRSKGTLEVGATPNTARNETVTIKQRGAASIGVRLVSMTPLIQNKEFQHWTLDEKQVVKADRIAAAFDRLLVELTTPGHYPDDTTVLVPTCRETSIMRTKLEEACFFAKKAMASNPAQVEIKMPELPVPPPPPPPTDTPPSSPQS